MNSGNDWQELADRHLRGELSESEKERLAELLDSDSAARRDFVEFAEWDTRLMEVLRDEGRSLEEPLAAQPAGALSAGQRPTIREGGATLIATRVLLAIAGVVIVALMVRPYFQRQEVKHEIAKITGMSGEVLWTGDGGRVAGDVHVGTKLFGGTIEGMAPDSWVEFQFNDGSSITISGNSVLTFSDHGQKELHLKEGNLSGNVKPQPPGKPMRIHTRSAMLAVVGTQFEVEAGLMSTMLNVSEGEVRLKRLSDGSTVDVRAQHRVIAAPDHDIVPVRVPDSVSHWKSQLHLGPDRTYGKWSPATDQQAASLSAIPYVPSENQSVTLYLLSLPVSGGDSSPVILRPGCRLVVRGRLANQARLYVGIRMAHPNGEFAGKFRAFKPASEFTDGQDFEAELPLDEFELDPSVYDIRDELPDHPDGLVVTCVWCFTHHENSGNAGLELTEVEILPPVQAE